MNTETKTLTRITGAAGGTGMAVGADQDWLQILGIVIAAISTIAPIIQKMLEKRQGPPAILYLLFSILVLSGCAGLQPAAPAPGQDAVVINAERAQVVSLDAFQHLDQWEATHRAALSPPISRAVDDVRDDFPPLWQASRNALSEYKAARPPDRNATALEKITAALNAAALTLNQINGNSGPAQITALLTSLTSLAGALNSQPSTLP